MEKYMYTTAVLLVMCKQKLASPYVMVIWNYLLLRDGQHIKITQFREHTGLSTKVINASLKLLLTIGVVTRERESVTETYAYIVKPLYIKKSNIPLANSTPLLLYTSILDTSNISSLLGNNTSKLVISSSRENSTKKVTYKGILEDKDWAILSRILRKYFTEDEIKPTDLLYRGRWNRVCVMLYEGYDFDMFADWYKEYKYDRLQFSWGLFLSKTMREEFERVKDRYLARKQRTDKRLHTTKSWKDKKIDMSWVDDLEDIDE